MHRTTIEMDDQLLRTLKRLCVSEGRRLKHLVVELIRGGLEARTERRHTAAARLATWHTSKRPLPAGIDPADRTSYLPDLERPLPCTA
ncbi:MAG: hypothetical protein HY696_11455 [Deltaproteobacteria bacterium]|nr:hypothetical protein [Deltaproteobacteria bacterium]